jgi:hypothetical protein
MGLVDSGQSIVRPTITKSPTVFQSTRVHAAAQFSGVSDAIEATNPLLASEQNLLRAMTKVACVLFKMPSLRYRDEGSNRWAADWALGASTVASISVRLCDAAGGTLHATA